MKLVIHGRNIEITDAIREHVEQKILKAVSHFKHLTNEVDVHLSVAKNPRIGANQAAEVTLFVDGAVVRAEESSENLYASIDLVADKISRQLRKFKEKRNTRMQGNLGKTTEAYLNEAPLTDVTHVLNTSEPQLPEEVIRTKYFAMSPMSVSDALEQLAVIDHDFYMFLNAETEEINVIYERNHGGYGLIQPRKPNSNSHQNGHTAQQSVEAAAHS
ncbi:MULTISPECIES: ribosome-associated translation inhibitor RaiA [Cyanophyceae]|uniref:ribosome hibernation-promoting factor, HPF/YfiA family n=1 Tax=Cyanophyceae TaxID=3028117 RepID=UPI001683FF13|nr:MULTISPECIES: ribosome-associated translation inhibitor RaiA [Cyanophyceae]MBD1916948.1 ribosome-associated translation inhibitor RaiA [Phormidium sp. FACHB-77]MBD2029799.1 ribosome-associated translation inhibitor RaiA [Phormidium sp. FACHB-322]MBD2050413.1 ribosome-associated translation inhibitor RaiA [Leptolyngbya sp. FACHB-60]